MLHVSQSQNPHCRLYRTTPEQHRRTGLVKFNDKGDRSYVDYDLVNTLDNGAEQIVGNYTVFYNTTTNRMVRLTP